MTRPPCYIAAPFGAPTAELRRLNTYRAELIGRLAMLEGLAPIVVHSGIIAGVYGDDTDPDQRAAGMAATRRIAAMVARVPGAEIWSLTRDDGSLSDGTSAELVEWAVALQAAQPGKGRTGTWATYAGLALVHGIEGRWAWMNTEYRAAGGT